MQSGGANNSRRLAQTWPYPRHIRFERALRLAAARWFAERRPSFALHPRYPYILAKWEDWHANIIDDETVRYIRAARESRLAEGGTFPLHDYLHHGLSSQAMLFNLMGPLLARDELYALCQPLAPSSCPWSSTDVHAELEFSDRDVFHEDTGQPTSVDLAVIESGAGRKVFVEAKLAEKAFGGCSVFLAGDCDGRNPAQRFSMCYLHHIGRKYWDLLAKWGFLESAIGRDSTCVLASHYQFFRELLFSLEHGATFVLLSDRRSPTFACDGPDGRRGLMAFLADLVPPQIRGRIAIVHVQDVVQSLKRSGQHPWAIEFCRKYGLEGLPSPLPQTT